MSATGFVAVTAIMFAGAFVQGSVGFGLNLIAAPVLLLIDEALVPGPSLAAAAVLTLLISLRDRSGMDRRAVGLALTGRLPATLAAAFTLAVLPDRGTALVFAGLILASVAILASGVHVPITATSLVSVGALSGYMATATSVGGPPMAMLYAGESGSRLRGTLSGFFVIGAVLSLAALAAFGELSAGDVGRTASLVPGAVGGFLASAHGAAFLDRGFIRPAVLAVSAVAAVSVVFDAL